MLSMDFSSEEVKMKIEEFLALTAPDRYDFSNDGASEEYCKLDGFQDTYEKFFAYMYKTALPLTCYEEGKAGVMACGAAYKEECNKRFGTIPDPDSGSDLLQIIYKTLWHDVKSLNYCKKGNKIQGETMNSANTTLGELYKYNPKEKKRIETLEQYNKRRAIKPVKYKKQNVSIAYIISRYAEEKSEQEEKYDKIEGLKDFLSVYHTLGNFIPVPADCNGPRGTGRLSDYWDLTLKIIYDYYICRENNVKNENKIRYIIGESKNRIKLYENWLNSFQEDDRPSWQCFIEKNYLQDFVNQNVNGSYGMPKELWIGHFSDFFSGKTDALPHSIKQIEEFCVNASCFIMARSTRMLIRLRKLFQGDAERA